MKKSRLIWKVSFLLSFIGFLLIENAFTIEPDVTSGNGNLGILIILLFSPAFLASYISTFKLAKEKMEQVKKKRKSLIIKLLTIVICVLAFMVIDNAKELIQALGGTPDDPHSRIYRFGWFNQYTNSMYFNVYTFFMSHIAAVMIGMVFSFKRREH